MIYARKMSILSLVGSLLLIIVLGFIAVLNINTGHGVAGIVCGIISGLMVFALAGDCRSGIRRANAWEWFKSWMCVRPVVVGVIGVGVLWVSVQLFSTPPSTNPLMMAGLVVFSIFWFALLIYFIFRAPHRWESDAQYKHRIGYKEMR